MRRGILSLVAAALLWGCGGDDALAGTIEPGTFIATWVDLREAAAGRGGVLPESERIRVLQENGVTEDELLAFVDAHGEDPRFMLEIWVEVEARLRPPPPNDTTAQSSG